MSYIQRMKPVYKVTTLTLTYLLTYLLTYMGGGGLEYVANACGS